MDFDGFLNINDNNTYEPDYNMITKEPKAM